MGLIEESNRDLARRQNATQSELDTLFSVTRDLVAISRQSNRRLDNLEAGESQA